MRSLALLFIVASGAWGACTTGSSGKCEVGAGKTYATIQACLNAMTAPQTCLVFAGTYSERPTIPAGTTNNYNVVQANGSDVVNVLGFTMSSWTQVVGNCPVATNPSQTSTGPGQCGFDIENPNSPTTDCITVPASTSFATIRANFSRYCGPWNLFGGPTIPHVNHISILQNTITHTYSVAPNGPGPCFLMYGDYLMVEQNDCSHASDWDNVASGLYHVYRNNYMHDSSGLECAARPGFNDNCHIDFIEMEPNGNASNGNPVPTGHILEEGQVENNVIGQASLGCVSPNGQGVCAGHGNLIQGDTCLGQCDHWIIRYNVHSHIGGGAVLNDLQVFGNNKVYNNSWVDVDSECGTCGGGESDIHGNAHNNNGGAELNNLFYFPSSKSDFNAYDFATAGQFGNSLAFCATGSCVIHGNTYGSGSFLSDPGNIMQDPLLVNYAGGDFHLSSGSPAIGAGAPLTTATGCSGSVLTVADPKFFQDGWTFPAGTGLGQMVPDTVRIGPTQVAQIASNGINYATGQMTMQVPVSCNPGDPIYLYRDSTGTLRITAANGLPNIGALGTASAPPPATHVRHRVVIQ